MNAQEIVNILKENKTKGVAYLFLPEDVWEWVREHLDEPKLLYLNPSGNWDSLKDVDFDDFDNFVFALDKTYELPQKPSSEWVEFTITDGVFTAKIECDEGESYTEDFHWWNWQEFLDQASNYDMGFTAFGGWQYSDTYADKDIWYLYPQIYKESIAQRYASYFGKDTDDVKPAIPVKIRFWREVK